MSPRAFAELAGQLLRRGKRVQILARGGSMAPFLMDGSVVLVEPVTRAALAVGDVVCYELWPGRLFLHRVVRKDARRVIARGDALSWIHFVAPHQVLGRVVATKHRGRWRRLGVIGRWRGRVIARAAPVVACILPAAIALRRRWHGRRAA